MGCTVTLYYPLRLALPKKLWFREISLLVLKDASSTCSFRRLIYRKAVSFVKGIISSHLL
jgi:hypothetical protein